MTSKGHILSVAPIIFGPLIFCYEKYPAHIEKFLFISSEISLIIFFYGALIGSLLPDIDEPNSSIGKKTRGISDFINLMFGHRGITHSLLFVTTLYLLAFLSPSFLSPLFVGLALGSLAHIIGDMSTKESANFVLYPVKLKLSILPYSLKFATNGILENFVIIPILLLVNFFVLKRIYEMFF